MLLGETLILFIWYEIWILPHFYFEKIQIFNLALKKTPFYKLWIFQYCTQILHGKYVKLTYENQTTMTTQSCPTFLLVARSQPTSNSDKSVIQIARDKTPFGIALSAAS